MNEKQMSDDRSDVQVDSDGRRWLFDPAGLFLVAVVGSFGSLCLLRHSWILGIPCVALAGLGLIASHSHFDRSKGT